MSNITAIEERQPPPRPESLTFLEGKTFNELPEELTIKDKDIMPTLRELANRTQIQGIEWSMYILKNILGGLETENIKPGEETQAEDPDFEDLTGLFEDDDPYVSDTLREIIKSEKGRDANNVKFFLGRNLPDLSQDMLPPGVKVKPGTEFFALVHTHPKGETFSPGDLGMLIYQANRLDGRPKIPISIVIGKDDFYILVIPTDGQAELRRGPLEDISHWNSTRKLNEEFDRRTPDARRYEELLPFIREKARERNFGFYHGSLASGEAKRIDLTSQQ